MSHIGREIQGYYEAIDWAGVQQWSSGRVILCGISYFAITQWQVAAKQPPHLAAAMIPWEGAADFLSMVVEATKHLLRPPCPKND
jgi:uncharacterized protein